MNRATRALRVVLGTTVVVCGSSLVYLIAVYFNHAHDVRRYHLESRLIVLVAAGITCVLLAPIKQRSHELPPSGAAFKSRQLIVLVLGACLVAGTLYWPALQLGLLSDDFVLRERALAGDFIEHGQEFVRPIPLLLWAGLLRVSSGSEVVLHAANILLHALNAVMVAVLGRTLGLSVLASVGVATLFLVWPTHVEAVAWLAGVHDIMMATALLSLCVLAVRTQPTHWRVGAAVGLLVIALGSKETAVAAPVLIAAMMPASVHRRMICRRYIPPLILLVGVFVVWRWSLGLPTGYLVWPSRYVIKELLSRSFGSLAVPWPASQLANQPWLPVIAGWAVVTGLMIGFLGWCRQGIPFRRTLMGAAWTILATAPVYSYLFVGPDLQGSRYLYLATVGWVVVLAELLGLTRPGTARRQRLAIAAVILIGVSLASDVRVRIDDWSHAALVRDKILRAAHEAERNGRCATVSFDNLPDNINGVYVFRNGFYEAMRLTSPDTRATPTGDCRLRWSGSRFELTLATR